MPSAWPAAPYPETTRGGHVDTYRSARNGSVDVQDDYYWLEEDSPGRERWLDEQQGATEAFLGQNRQGEEFKRQLEANWAYSRFSAPTFVNDKRWYWYFNSGLQAQYVLYRSRGEHLPTFDVNGADGPEANGGEVFFDTNLLVEDATASLSATAFSKCGNFFAYGVSLSGSDFFTIYVRSTEFPFNKRPDGHLGDAPGCLDDVIRFVKFSTIVWKHDSTGFFYQGFPQRKEHGEVNEDKAGTETTVDKHAKLFFHKIGTPQSADVIAWDDKSNPTWFYGVGIDELRGRYLELYISKDTSHKNKLYITDLQAGQEIGPDLQWFKVIDTFDAEYSIVSNDDRKFFMITDKDTTRKKVVTFVLPEEWTEEPLSLQFGDFVPEDSNGGTLTQFSPVNGKAFVAKYSRNVCDELHIVSSTGEFLQRLDPDFVGTLSFSAKRDRQFFFVTLSGFNNPGVIKRFDFPDKDSDVVTGASFEPWRKTYLKGLLPDEFVTKQVFYESKDGTEVPMFIVSHRDTPTDGTAPALQYGYGGFSYTITPFFSPGMLTFIKCYHGIIAVPGIRGGAEFGEQWHEAGIREKRTVVFDDFIAATEYLVKEGYAGKGKIAINGASNGGTLVAACINRSPETFGAAVAEVGVMDLLKFPKYTIGAAWISDYGDPSDPEDFDFIYSFSPLHNVPEDKKLPPTMLLTADHDDRVVPLHTFKHIATMQYAQTKAGNTSPLLLRVERKSGHGAGKSTEKAIQEAADKWGFVAQVLNLPFFLP